MRLNHNTQEEGEWRPYFAWTPIYVKEINSTVWMGTVERRYENSFGDLDGYRIYTYRMPRGKNSEVRVPANKG